MTKNRVLLMLVISSLSVSLFAGGFALSGVGSRATAMGGAFRGLSDDATAMFWNPAGLAFQDGLKVDLGGTFIMPSATWENPDAALTGLRPGEKLFEELLVDKDNGNIKTDNEKIYIEKLTEQIDVECEILAIADKFEKLTNLEVKELVREYVKSYTVKN